MSTLDWPAMFSDEVFTSTDLNRRASEVLSRAAKRPVTISRSNEQFALLRREQVGGMIRVIHASQAAVEALLEARCTIAGSEPSARRFSWLKAYDKDDLQKFSLELLSALDRVLSDDCDPEELSLLIHEWHESALAVQSGVIDSAMHAEPAQRLEIPRPVELTKPSSLDADD